MQIVIMQGVFKSDSLNVSCSRRDIFHSKSQSRQFVVQFCAQGDLSGIFLSSFSDWITNNSRRLSALLILKLNSLFSESFHKQMCDLAMLIPVILLRQVNLGGPFQTVLDTNVKQIISQELQWLFIEYYYQVFTKWPNQMRKHICNYNRFFFLEATFRPGPHVWTHVFFKASCKLFSVS